MYYVNIQCGIVLPMLCFIGRKNQNIVFFMADLF